MMQRGGTSDRIGGSSLQDMYRLVMQSECRFHQMDSLCAVVMLMGNFGSGTGRPPKTHNGVCIDFTCHPVEPNKLANCSWDGTIKLWD